MRTHGTGANGQGAVQAKTPEQIARMRVAGRLAAQVLDEVGRHVAAGVTTEALDALAHAHIVDVQGAVPAPLDYHGYPKSICTSVNDSVCHEIPGPRVLAGGDIVNVDVTVLHDGVHADASRMWCVGEVSREARRLCEIAREAMWVGIEAVRPGVRLGDIGHVIARCATHHGFSVVREYAGHGIGTAFHEPPQVLNYSAPNTGPVIEEGWTFTIEPMINAGARHVRLLDDGWTVVTHDGRLSAQWEHTIAVTPNGAEILTAHAGAQG